MVTTFPTTQDMPEPTRLTPEKRYAMELTQHYRMLQCRFETRYCGIWSSELAVYLQAEIFHLLYCTYDLVL